MTTGNPDQGFEGYRFVGYNLYDSLVLWDLSQGDKAADIKPGLATEWHIDEGDNKRWIFTLRQGVKWHDGCPSPPMTSCGTSSYSSNDKAPQFNPAQFAQARPYLGTYAGVEKVDDHTVAFITKVPDSLFPYEISYVLMISPCRAKEVNNNWTRIRAAPVGHRALQIRQDGARTSGSKWCRTPIIGTRPACRSRTGWCWCRCRKRQPAPRRCCRARSIGSRRRRPTRSTG